MLEKEVSKVFDLITKEWDRNTVQITIKETLLTKRKRVTNEREYFNSLCENVIYLIESCEVIKALLGQCLQQKTFLDTAHAESAVVNAQNNIKKDMAKLLKKYNNLLNKNTLSESIEQAEFLYGYHKLKYDMEIDFLFAFLHPNNRSIMNTFLTHNAMQVLTAIDNSSNTYSTLFVQSMTDFMGISIRKRQNKLQQQAKKKRKRAGLAAFLVNRFALSIILVSK